MRPLAIPALTLAALTVGGGQILQAVGWLAPLDPPGSAFMLERRLGLFWDAPACPAPSQTWVDRERIPVGVALAVVASEDQRFLRHRGFDLEAIGEAMDEARRGDSLRGASTLSQQLAKNLFLWPGRSWVRKALEVPLTAAVEARLSKARILEIYLNVAQLGPCVFGVEAAARELWGIPAAELDSRRAALLAATLPSPFRSRPGAPSGYLSGRARWIEAQVAQLGPAAWREEIGWQR